MKRQGELLFRKVNKAKGKLLDHKIIAEGEKTGNRHEVVGNGELYEENGMLYLHCDAPCEIVHPDHKPLTLPQGDFEIIIQREYEISESRYRKVVDWNK